MQLTVLVLRIGHDDPNVVQDAKNVRAKEVESEFG